MILAVDVGNTQTVLGTFDGDTIIGHWRIGTDPSMTADELRLCILGLLSLEGIDVVDVTNVIISSVVPSLTAAYVEVAGRIGVSDPMVVGPGIKTGMPIHYDNPHEVGADRIVNGVAAFDEYGGPVVVIDLGTATTLDVIDSNGAYLGGAIAPGVETSAAALFAHAARLSQVDLAVPENVIGSNTRVSVQSGLIVGHAAMIDGLVGRIESELGVPCEVVATGGLVELIAPLCETVKHVEPDLTLRGLMLVFQRNLPGKSDRA